MSDQRLGNNQQLLENVLSSSDQSRKEVALRSLPTTVVIEVVTPSLLKSCSVKG
jgi:hypothetical protein